MPSCPTCGSPGAPCACEIASWVEGAPASVASTIPEQSCTACGYSGEMIGEGRGTTCPACEVVLPARRAGVTLRVTQLIECPECGRQIGITAEDRGRTVVCPGCSYFLGTPMVKSGRDDQRAARYPWLPITPDPPEPR